jgi:hypothetical protein
MHINRPLIWIAITNVFIYPPNAPSFLSPNNSSPSIRLPLLPSPVELLSPIDLFSMGSEDCGC